MKFAATSKLNPLNQDMVNSLLESAAPNAFIQANREMYLPLVESELVEFLWHTKLDRNIWREAQPKSHTAEMVCTSFSLLLWALFEQERLKTGCEYPFAFGRVSLSTHSLNGFVNEKAEFKIVEPQNDRVLSLAEFAAAYPDNKDIQIIALQ